MARTSFGKGCTWLRLDLALVALLAAFIAVFLLSLGAQAQVENGIHGTIMDASGAVITGAHVSVTNASTGVTSTAVTSTEGTYTIIGLIPGHYSLTVEATQFKKAQTEATVEVAKMSSVDIKLQPGSANETVNVSAASISLETSNPSIGATLEPELVRVAPLEISGLSRQIDAFIYLAPGVQGTTGSHNINGGVTYENEVQFNGIPVAFVDYSGNQTYINPPYEAVSEFRVDSSTFDARYGIGQGSVTYNMASGSNKLHGDVFEIVRNQLFDSSGFFPIRFQHGHPAPPIDHENDYGFTLGGPVYIPHVYDGRSRTFFHFSLDLFRQNLAQNGIGTVPTAAMKNGDFSQFVDATPQHNLIPIYDPQTGQPFPGNRIPKDRFSSLAQSLLPSIPDPDTAGTNGGLQNNKLPTISSLPIRQNLWAFTIDHNLSQKQSLHFSEWRNTVTAPYLTSAPIVTASNPLQSEVSSSLITNAFLVNYVNALRSNLVVSAGMDWIQYNTNQSNANMKVSFGGVTGGNTLPLVVFDGQNTPTTWGVAGGAFLECCSAGMTVNLNHRRGIVLVNNWLWSKGRHTFNIGGQFRLTAQDITPCQFCSGTFNFSQRTTSTPNSSDPNFGSFGSSFASFLLGQADAGIRIFANQTQMRNKAFAAYLQDDIKVNKRLTVNVGVRWDVMVPFTEKHDNIVYVNRSEPNPAAGGLLGTPTKFGSCDGCSGIHRAAIHWKYVQPRIGFAYSLNQKTVVRGGLYVTMLDGGAYEYGTAQSASFMSTLLQGQFLRASTGGSNPGYGSWDASAIPQPSPTPLSPGLANAKVIFDFPSTHANRYPELPTTGTVGKAPYDTAWNLGVQRELPWDMFFTASYVGNRAIHLPTTLELSNQPNPSVLKYGSLLGEAVNSPDAIAAGIQIPYPNFVSDFGGAATVEQALAPYPQFGGFFPVYEMDGTAFYNALQMQAEKRFKAGLSFLQGVTFSRNTANTSIGSAPFSPNGLNAYNPGPEYVPSYLDQFYVVTTAATYELPIGYGKKYLHSRGLLGQLAGGWQISAILNYGGGTAMGAFNGFNPLLVNGFDRPDIDPSVHLQTFDYNLSKKYFKGELPTQPVQFATNAFTNTGAWGVGNSKRAYSALRSPPLRLENIGVSKYFNIREGVRAILKVDYFNVFNRTRLQAPDTNSLDSTFGQIVNLSSQISNRQGQATFRIEF